MVDDIPHDGASLGMEADPEHVPLPPRVRPFDPETYHPEIIDEAGFGLFCAGLSRLIASRPLLGALVERWWDTTNSFHFFTVEDMTMTPYDFVMLTGIEVYAYFSTLAPELEVEMPPVVPYSYRYDSISRGSPGRRCLRVAGTSLLALRAFPIIGLYSRTGSSHATSAIHTGYKESLLPGGASSIRQGFGWPALPTELTSWRHTGEAYQIPIEPAPAGHRYVRAPNSSL
ncbi:Protein MAIN-LIKE 2, partial [Camellia lanceoleosa]